MREQNAALAEVGVDRHTEALRLDTLPPLGTAQSYEDLLLQHQQQQQEQQGEGPNLQ